MKIFAFVTVSLATLFTLSRCGTTAASGALTIKGAGGTSTQASDPGELKVKIYKVAFSTSEFCTDPVTVFERTTADATYADFLSAPNIAENVTLADGTYKCVIIEFSDTLKFTTTTTDGNCAANTEYELNVCRSMVSPMLSTLIDGTSVTCTDGEDHVAMYLSTTSTETTGADGHSPWTAPTTASDATKGFNLASAFVKAGAATGTFVVDGTGKVMGNESPCGFNPPLFSFR